jgi:hypothetical protein
MLTPPYEAVGDGSFDMVMAQVHADSLAKRPRLISAIIRSRKVRSNSCQTRWSEYSDEASFGKPPVEALDCMNSVDRKSNC